MSTEELRDLLADYNAARNDLEVAEVEFKAAETELMTYLQRNQVKSAAYERANGTTLRVTVVAGTTTKLDESKLKKLLGARVWNRYTNRVIDKKKLEAALEVGEVDPILVGQCVSEVPKKIYLRASEAAHEDA